MDVEVIETPELGNRTYVVSDGSTALVVDPPRDIDRVEQVLERVATSVSFVLETHVHNDYLSGGLELARRVGAEYGVNTDDAVRFARRSVSDGDVLAAGRLRVRALATPGHTATHLAYHVTSDDGAEPAVFTGGSLLFGSVGRTDLVDAARTRSLSYAQYASAHRLAALPPTTALYPTHGFGSFCAAGAGRTTPGSAGTIGDELEKNPVFRAASVDTWVDDLIASLDAYPSYYAHMAPQNLRGAGPVDLTRPVPTLSAATVRDRIAAGEIVVDLRDRVAYAARHVPGTLAIGRGQQFATYLGWLVPYGAAVTLVADSQDDLADARRQLARIGFDDVTGTTEPIGSLGSPRSLPRRNFEHLARHPQPGETVLDVRTAAERAAGSLAGSLHIPLYELAGRLAEIPPGRVWVYCASGFRAGIAASILENAGYDVVHVDDSIDRAFELGLVAA